MTISTHVLDASTGTPAAGVSVTLSRLAGSWLDVESGVTDADGRHRFARRHPRGDVLPDVRDRRVLRGPRGRDVLPRGRGHVHDPGTRGGNGDAAGAGHFHVPLLLSPFAYSTYRGS